MGFLWICARCEGGQAFAFFLVCMQPWDPVTGACYDSVTETSP